MTARLPDPRPALRRFGGLALFGAIYAYVLTVTGGIVRITGTGHGCGDTWPRCQGQWIPPLETAAVLDWAHRSLSAGAGLVILGLVGYALAHRARPGFSGRGGVLRPTALALGLVVAQGALGALSVRMDLPAMVRALYFVTAMVLIALLLAAAVRAGRLGAAAIDRAADDGRLDAARARSVAGSAIGAAVLGFLVVALGAVTANVPGAAGACTGFPLCSGQLLPSLPQAHVHWTHRIVAFLLLFHLLGATIAVARRGAAPGIRTFVLVSFGLALAQVVVAAGMVSMRLPASFRITHLLLGAALWATIACWLLLARRARTAATTTGTAASGPPLVRA
jgi:heme a synthase